MKFNLFQSSLSWPVYGEYDVVVCGAGPGGIGSAIAASRAGKKTVIIEQAGFPGGTATQSLVPHIMGLALQNRQISGGIADEFVRRLDMIGKAKFNIDEASGTEGAVIGKKELIRDVMTDVNSFTLILNRLLNEAGVERLFYSTIIGAVVEGREVAAVAVNFIEGQALIKGKMFIDATADANLINFAGGDTRYAAPEEAMTKTMIFDVDNVTEFDRRKIQEAFKKKVEEGDIPIPLQDHFMAKTIHLPDEVHLNFTAVAGDSMSSADMSRMDMELREQIDAGMEWYKQNIPGFADSRLIRTPSRVGVRAGRGAVGIETITMKDIVENTAVKEPVCLGIRRCGDHGTKKFTADWAKNIEVNGTRPVPLGTLISKDFDNVFMAGRSISCEPKLLTCIRYIAVCFCTGQAAGTAAEICIDKSIPAKDIPYPVLKERLLHQKAIIE